VPEFDRLESKNFLPPDGGDSLEFNFAYKDNELVGVAVNTWTNKGYSGRISAMVGFNPDGTIIDVVHLEHKETPGLGDKIDKSKSEWSDQFQGIDPQTTTLKVTKDNGDIDAITAATITSRAYCDAIQRAYDTFTDQELSQTKLEGGPEL
jgi:electron transport complex protein RnfG